jgi:uncharacterized protein (TIGR00730 family)
MDWSIRIPSKPLRLPLNGKYVIFSDLHRDKFRNKAGNFWYNQDLYRDALEYYLKNGYTLIENGDGEELWQFSLKEIISSNLEIYELFARFYEQNRLHLIYGNHNVDMKFRIVHSYWTEKYMPKVKFRQLIFIGDHILITHGHQWDLVYRLGFIPVRLIVRFWKYMEYLGFGSFDPSIPSANIKQVMKIDKKIIDWGNDYGYVMICGHTHYAKFLPDGEFYFNSGCGTVEGRLTGLEVVNGKISLIRWKEDGSGIHKRTVLSETKLPKNRENVKWILRKRKTKEENKNVITIFGSSAPKRGDVQYETAAELGKLLAEKGFAVKNGGYAGTMEAASRGAAGEGGEAIGVLLSKSGWGKGNKYLTERLYALSLPERIEKLIKDSEGFIILPGGTGTLAEISLLVEMIHKGMIKRVPVVFLGDYWDDQIEVFRKQAKSFPKFGFNVKTPAEAVKRIMSS